MLIRNARVVPVTSAAPDRPVDVLVEDGRVTEVGPGLDPAGKHEQYDADGRWLIPGLWDQHVHAGQWARASSRLDLSSAHSPEDALASVAARLLLRPDADQPDADQPDATAPQ